MRDLFVSEWRRFRRAAWGVLLAHALGLVFLSRAVDLLQLGYGDHAAMLLLYIVLGFVLALVQVGSYRKPSQWLWLIHRPLPPARIFAALAGSAVAMLALALCAPLLGWLLATDFGSSQVVDARHYLAVVHVLAFATMGWFAGALASIGRSKLLAAVLAAPLLLALHLASAWALLVPVLACVAWLGWIARHAFRADRDAPIARTGVLLLTALPLQLAFFVLLFHTGRAGVELADLLRPRYPARTVTADDAGAVDAHLRTFGQDFVRKGLAGSRDPRAVAWRAQLPLLELADLVPDVEAFPVRHQVGNLPTRRWDEARRIAWTFSHDRMLFRGRDPKTGEDRGWWGRTGAGSAPYAQIPMGDLSRDTWTAIDAEAQREHVLVTLPAGEWFTGRPVRAHGRLLVRTNRQLRVYRPAEAATGAFAAPALDWSLPLPASPGQKVHVSVVELLDGWLVSLFYFTPQDFAGFERLRPQWQQVLHVDADGVATPVGLRRGIDDHHITMGGSPAVPEGAWWLSPVLYTLARWPATVLDTGATDPPRLAAWPRFRLFWLLAGACSLVSLGLAAWWLRRVALPAPRRRLWLALCALLGPPAFLSLACLERRAARS